MNLQPLFNTQYQRESKKEYKPDVTLELDDTDSYDEKCLIFHMELGTLARMWTEFNSTRKHIERTYVKGLAVLLSTGISFHNSQLHGSPVPDVLISIFNDDEKKYTDEDILFQFGQIFQESANMRLNYNFICNLYIELGYMLGFNQYGIKKAFNQL